MRHDPMREFSIKNKDIIVRKAMSASKCRHCKQIIKRKELVLISCLHIKFVNIQLSNNRCWRKPDPLRLCEKCAAEYLQELRKKIERSFEDMWNEGVEMEQYIKDEDIYSEK